MAEDTTVTKPTEPSENEVFAKKVRRAVAKAERETRLFFKTLERDAHARAAKDLVRK